VCSALAGEECVFTTAPVSIPVVPDTEVRPVRGYHAARLDETGADVAVALGATAAVWDNGDAPRLPVPAEGADREAAQDVLKSIRERLDNLGADVCELSAAFDGPRGRVAELAAELLDDPDDTETYCSACGHWIGVFLGMKGWHHFTGDPAPGGNRDLYDADHDPVPAWMIPVGRALAPADLHLVRQALAAAAADVSYWTPEAVAYEELAERLGGFDVAPGTGTGGDR
jgi:hypothetical protein